MGEAQEPEVISHLNLSVSQLAFTKLLQVTIEHEVNMAGRCTVAGEMPRARAEELTQRADETQLIEVCTTARGQPPRLFCGYLSRLETVYENDYAVVTAVLEGTCRQLDLTLQRRSYQNTGATYGELIAQSAGDRAAVALTVSDRRTGTLIVQYEETDWAFCMRMASQLGAPIAADIQASEPHFYVGLPPSDRVRRLPSTHMQLERQLLPTEQAAVHTSVSEHGTQARVSSYCYLRMGSFVQLAQQFYAVKSIQGNMRDGLLEMHYGLLALGSEMPAAGSTTDVQGLAAPAVSNSACSGKMLSGTVRGVSGSKVQVQFSFDGQFAGNHWFEYSTAYSSGDQSGWYCMPEPGDTVRVFFPSGNEGEAFAAGASPKFAGQSPKDKVWMSNGKAIELTENGIRISCDGAQALIDLSPEQGITISSQQGICICAAGEIKMSAETISLVAQEKISVGTDSAFLEISADRVALLGGEVVVE